MCAFARTGTESFVQRAKRQIRAAQSHPHSNAIL